MPSASPQVELLPEAADAPLECKRSRVPVLEPGQAKALDDVGTEELLLAVPRQLEDAAPAREDAAIPIADDEAGVRGRVVVVQQLEEEPEPAALARDRHVVQLLEAVVVDGAVL